MALGVRPDLPEPAALLEALPHHHELAERLRAAASSQSASCPTSTTSKARWSARSPSASRKITDLSLEADARPLHVHGVRSLQRQLSRPTPRARSSRPSTSRSRCATTCTPASRSLARGERRRGSGKPKRSRSRGRRSEEASPSHEPAAPEDGYFDRRHSRGPRAEHHRPRRDLGLHQLPRLRRAVPGDDHATSTRSSRCAATW